MAQCDLNIAVVGATGAVGETMLEILAQREVTSGKVHALASANSAGKRVRYGDRNLVVADLATFDFSQVRVALFSAGGPVSAEFVPKAAAAGCVVIDNTSHFRRDDDIPLVVTEVNPELIADHRQRNIIANPNCSTMQMLVALKPIYDAAGIERINVSTYQAVSGAGRSAIEKLAGQTARLLNAKGLELEDGEKQIAFNALPHIDVFQENGYTREEMKMVWETRKILEDEAIGVNATAVRIPVFYGHSEAVCVETRELLEIDAVRGLLTAAAGIEVLDDQVLGGYPTPVTEAAGTDPVFIGRIRRDISHPRGINLWIVADNIRKGAALNSVQIAEILVKKYL
ncbi:MAG: aspartate-semialdehyde dehydrogenase [Pseudomonadota bacterium]